VKLSPSGFFIVALLCCKSKACFASKLCAF